MLHGNQEANPVRSDSPTVKKLRIQLSIAIQNGWVMCSSDVQAAFLQATELDCEVFVKPVPEANHQGLLWRLKKPMYGCITLITDLAFAHYIKDGQLHSILTMHVDDIQHCTEA